MTSSAFGTISTWSYGAALAGYLVFALRAAIGYRKSSRAKLLLLALVATAVWAGLCLQVGRTPTPNGLFAANVAEAFRYAAWFAFVASLLHEAPHPEVGGRPQGSTLVIVGAAVFAALILGVLLTDGSSFLPVEWQPAVRVGQLFHLGMAVFGLVLIEHVLRRVLPQMRWGVRPLAIALACVFGLDLYLYSDAALFGQLDPAVWLSRGFANAIVIPLVAVATARNTGWTVDLHLSRRAVFHSSALLMSGAFLLLIAGAGYFIRYFGGDWGHALQIELLFVAALLVVLVGTSGRFRSRLKVFVSKHFFSYRYDYREEWLRFTHTLSTEGSTQTLQERSIVALANLVESPGGVLWVEDELRGYVPAARWNVPAVDGVEPADGALAAFLARTGWIIDVAEWREHPARYEDMPIPAWLAYVPVRVDRRPAAVGDRALGDGGAVDSAHADRARLGGARPAEDGGTPGGELSRAAARDRGAARGTQVRCVQPDVGLRRPRPEEPGRPAVADAEERPAPPRQSGVPGRHADHGRARGRQDERA